MGCTILMKIRHFSYVATKAVRDAISKELLDAETYGRMFLEEVAVARKVSEAVFGDYLVVAQQPEYLSDSFDNV